MRNPTLTFAWSTWRQHRPAIVIAFGFMLAASAISAILPLRALPESLMTWVGLFQWVGVIIAVLLSLLSVLAYADLQMDLLSRESCFPRPLLRLPVRTGSLVLWPIAFAFCVATILTLVVGQIIMPPWQELGGVHRDNFLPLWWPPALAAAFVAWLQALIWLPCGLPGLRLAILAVIYTGIIRFWVYAASNRLDEWTRVAAFGGMTITAWGVSYWGVRWARYGVVPDWGWILSPLSRLQFRSGKRSEAFRSAIHASDWLAWRLSGRFLPLATGVILFIALAAISLTSTFGERSTGFVPGLISFSMFTPPILAGIAGGWHLGGKTRGARSSLAMSPWLASMPLSDDERVRTALKSALWSTLAAYGVVAIAFGYVAVRILLSHRLHADILLDIERLFEHPRMPLGMLATGFTLVIWTWKRTLNSYLLGLWGRMWIIVEIGIWFCAYVTFVALALGLSSVNIRPDFLFEGVLGIMFAARLMLAGLAIFAGIERGYLSPRTAVLGIALWLTQLGGVLGVCFAVAGGQTDRQQWITFLFVVAAFPVVRLAASPFLVRLSRHR